MRHRRRGLVGAAVASAALGLAPAAAAFDSGPHSEITRDALAAEGFSRTATDVAVASNWFVDLYDNPKDIPASGHAGIITTIIGGNIPEFWSDAVIHAATHAHFDSTDGGFPNSAALGVEWDRLRARIGLIARTARASNDPDQLLIALGASLHEVQDFYAHTNWVEPAGPDRFRGGPDWAAKGLGATPTWFDIPEPARLGEWVYAGGSTGTTRKHGHWRSDGNRSLDTAVAKDWPGRPLYTEAHVAAYFATRQWVRAVRAAVGDDAFWARATTRVRARASLGRDLGASRAIGLATGHWQGEGEPCKLTCGERSGPGGSRADTLLAIRGYFSQGRSYYRRRWESIMVRLMAPAAGLTPIAVEPSTPLQRTTRFVRLRVTRMAQVDELDIPGSADLYAEARIAGVPLLSAVINGHDSFRFRRPSAPFTWLRGIPDGTVAPAPVRTMRVEITTGDVRLAGTDDDVYLRFDDRHRYQLDKRLYDDFERGDVDTYSVPIDAAIREGLDRGDIRYLQIEKSRDGVAGGWRLARVRVWIDGVRVLDERADRWLSGSSRTWRATTFTPTTATGPAVGVSIRLLDRDVAGRFDDDHADIFPWASRRDLALAYVPGSDPRSGRTRGGKLFGGRLGDGDRATLDWALDTYTPQAADPPPPPPPTPPDLRLTTFELGRFVVVNEGGGAAGPFLVSVTGVGTFPIAGLAAGASLEQTYPEACREGEHSATADSTGVIAESDETDNTVTYQQIC